MKSRDAQRVLQWYPAAWRRRYGEELIAMLDDTHGGDNLPRQARLSLVWPGLKQRLRLLRKCFRTYAGYSIGCAVVWAVILPVVWTQAGVDARHTFSVFFGGWAIGWLSATIGRAVYPPPKPRRPA